MFVIAVKVTPLHEYFSYVKKNTYEAFESIAQ
jgi:hypothetical protein